MRFSVAESILDELKLCGYFFDESEERIVFALSRRDVMRKEAEEHISDDQNLDNSDYPRADEKIEHYKEKAKAEKHEIKAIHAVYSVKRLIKPLLEFIHLKSPFRRQGGGAKSVENQMCSLCEQKWACAPFLI